LVAVEQPELHIHPRVQVGIGDLFTQIKNGPNFLVETHSEHLILRLLKRVRQTSNNELSDGVGPVLNTDISIIYLEPSVDGVQVKKIEVDEDGEFLVKWPKGFFAERREELM
jgi:predicted ATPase